MQDMLETAAKHGLRSSILSAYMALQVGTCFSEERVRVCVHLCVPVTVCVRSCDYDCVSMCVSL